MLAIEEEKVLVIDCIKKTMPVWVEIGKLNDFTEDNEVLGKEYRSVEANDMRSRMI